MLSINNTALVLIDVQEKLAGVMHERQKLIEQLVKLIRGARVLGLPILWCEQNPTKIGPTISQLVEHLDGLSPIAKMSFSCCGQPEFAKQLGATGVEQLLLAGIETHVCVYQTAADLVEEDYDVQVVADAVSSRTAENHDIGLRRIWDIGASLTSVEMAFFELLETAKNPQFKDILKIVK